MNQIHHSKTDSIDGSGVVIHIHHQSGSRAQREQGKDTVLVETDLFRVERTEEGSVGDMEKGVRQEWTPNERDAFLLCRNEEGSSRYKDCGCRAPI